MKVIFNVKRPPDGVLERIIYRGYTIDIVCDTSPQNPREYDNIGIMVSRDRKFSLDEKIPDYDYDTFEDLMDNVKEGYEALKEYLQEEVEEYNKYLAGEVYCYEVRDGEGNEIDFCCNYYDTDIAMLDAKIIINSEIEHRFKKHIQRLKKYIKGKVPLIYRKSFTTGL